MAQKSFEFTDPIRVRWGGATDIVVGSIALLLGLAGGGVASTILGALLLVLGVLTLYYTKFGKVMFAGLPNRERVIVRIGSTIGFSIALIYLGGLRLAVWIIGLFARR